MSRATEDSSGWNYSDQPLKNSSLEDFVEELLLQPPALITHEELADYKTRARELFEASHSQIAIEAERASSPKAQCSPEPKLDERSQ